MAKIDSEWKYSTVTIEINDDNHPLTIRYRQLPGGNNSITVEFDYEDLDRQTKQIKRLVENQE